MKQTAVKWLHYVSKQRELDKFDWEQAKEMEKEQIIEFADKYDAYVVQGGTLTAEQYYNETFKSE
jgi:phosphosulfolactate synthase (CoM biosynthesis protein A)